MEEDNRNKILREFLQHPLPCPAHPTELANLFVPDREPNEPAFICGLCYHTMVQAQPNPRPEIKPLKFIISHIHTNCLKLLQDLQTCAFVEHYLNMIRNLGKLHCLTFEGLFQAALHNYFQKFKDLVTGKYFQ